MEFGEDAPVDLGKGSPIVILEGKNAQQVVDNAASTDLEALPGATVDAIAVVYNEDIRRSV